MIVYICDGTRRFSVKLTEPIVTVPVSSYHLIFYKDSSGILLKTSGGLNSKEKGILRHGTHRLLTDETGKEIHLFCSDFDDYVEVFEHYKLPRRYITFGNSIEDDIYLQDPNLKPRHFVYDCQERMLVDLEESAVGAVNEVAFIAAKIKNGDVFSVFNLKVVFHESFLMMNTPKNRFVSLPLFTVPNTECCINEMQTITVLRTFRKVSLSLEFTEELEEPLSLDTGKRQSLLFLMGPSITMSLASLSTGLLSVYNGYLSGREINEMIPMILLPGVMLFSTLFWNPLQRILDRKKDRKYRKERLDSYHRYLEVLRKEIADFKTSYVQEVERLFPFTESLEKEKKQRAVYMRMPHQKDWMRVDAGTGKIPLRISLNHHFQFKKEDPLGNDVQLLIKEESEFFGPIILAMQKGITALVYEPNHVSYLYFLLLQLLAYQGKDCFKLVIYASTEWLNSHSFVYNIPHVYGPNGERFIATNQSELLELTKILKQSNGKEVLVLALKPGLDRILEEFNPYVLMPVERNSIPYDAGSRLLLEGNEGIYETESTQIRFTIPEIPSMDLFQAVFQLNHYYCSHLNQTIGNGVTFYELFNVQQVRDLEIEKHWNTNLVRQSVSQVLGLDEKGEPIELNLSENGNGPHGLIAGSTGSGKSELLISYILGLSVRYRPRELQFVFIDFKGGGAAQVFSKEDASLPHIAGVLSNLEPDGMERALVSFLQECKRREKLFSALSRKTGISIMHLSAYQSAWKKEYELEYLPSLVIVVDEFAELKKERPEFMKDLISIARIGRSLGIHLILATQKPSGIVDEQIWSNARFKICLKVQEKADSMEMIRSYDASYIHRPGEFYLLCDGVTVHGYSGYANAKSKPDAEHVDLLDHRGRVKESAGKIQEDNPTQATVVLKEIARIARNRGEVANPLWLQPPKTITLSSLNQNPFTVGIIDNFYAHALEPMTILQKEHRLLVFSIDKKVKESFFKTLLGIVVRDSRAEDEIFILDDIHLCSSLATHSSFINGILESKEGEKCRKLFEHLSCTPKSGIRYLMITDVSSFYQANPDYSLLLHTLSEQSELLHLKIVLFTNVAQSISYRDMALYTSRIALKNENAQDLSSIFECPVHQTVKEINQALIRKDQLLTVTLAATSDMEEHQCFKAKEGLTNRYRIPVLEEKISLSGYSGSKIPLGKQVDSYDWVVLEEKRLLVLSFYPYESQTFFQTVQGLFPDSLSFPSREDIEQWLQKGKEGIIMMTYQSYQENKLLFSFMMPILFIGCGFHNQYTFFTKTKKEIQENQGVYCHGFTSEVIQVVESA